MGPAPGADERRHPAVLVPFRGSGSRSCKYESDASATANAGAGTGRGTDLYEPLSRAPERIPNLRGIVLASDGDWNEGQPPVQAAARLRIKGVPILAVPLGSRTRLPDVELLSLDLPTFGIAGKSVRVPFTIDSSLPREYVTTVTLKTSDGDQVSKDLRIAPMSRTSDWLLWKPKATGDFTLTLVDPQAWRRDLGREQQPSRRRSRSARRNSRSCSSSRTRAGNTGT